MPYSIITPKFKKEKAASKKRKLGVKEPISIITNEFKEAKEESRKRKREEEKLSGKVKKRNLDKGESLRVSLQRNIIDKNFDDVVAKYANNLQGDVARIIMDCLKKDRKTVWKYFKNEIEKSEENNVNVEA